VLVALNAASAKLDSLAPGYDHKMTTNDGVGSITFTHDLQLEPNGDVLWAGTPDFAWLSARST
jgi:hypothetical protein